MNMPFINLKQTNVFTAISLHLGREILQDSYYELRVFQLFPYLHNTWSSISSGRHEKCFISSRSFNKCYRNIWSVHRTVKITGHDDKLPKKSMKKVAKQKKSDSILTGSSVVAIFDVYVSLRRWERPFKHLEGDRRLSCIVN